MCEDVPTFHLEGFFVVILCKHLLFLRAREPKSKLKRCEAKLSQEQQQQQRATHSSHKNDAPKNVAVVAESIGPCVHLNDFTDSTEQKHSTHPCGPPLTDRAEIGQRDRKFVPPGERSLVPIARLQLWEARFASCAPVKNNKSFYSIMVLPPMHPIPFTDCSTRARCLEEERRCGLRGV